MLWALVILMGMNFIGWRLGFYRLPGGAPFTAPVLTGADVVAVFFLYLSVNLIVFPLVAVGVLSASGLRMDPWVEGWAQVALIGAVGAALAVFYLFLSPAKRIGILRKNGWLPERYLYDAAFGAGVWLLGYPVILFVGQGISKISSAVFGKENVDQVAVRHLKETMSNQPLFIATAFAIIILVPAIEEFLFRGFLQTWLRRHFSLAKAILLSSFIFALFHFSLQQGVANIELLTSLFIFSLFLGYVYERQQSLVASVALHAVFNGISVLMIFQGF